MDKFLQWTKPRLARTCIIPNGINVERFHSARVSRPDAIPKVLGLVGRVVPIKDIKTFIRAMRSICEVMPETQGWIVGPEDEDPSYVQECKELVESLGLGHGGVLGAYGNGFFGGL